jgi:lysophospholipase L1-like esterase
VSYEPDLVVVQFCINDFDDPTKHFDLHSKQRLGLIPDAAYPDPAWRRAPLEAPYLPARYCRASRVCSRIEDALQSVFGTRLAPSEQIQRPGQDAQSLWWLWLDERYAEIEAASAAIRGSFGVLVVPYGSQLGSDSPAALQEILQLIAAQRGWLVIDPLPGFREAHAEGVEVLMDEWHPTPSGHRILSRELLAALTCRGPLPPSALRLCSE